MIRHLSIGIVLAFTLACCLTAFTRVVFAEHKGVNRPGCAAMAPPLCSAGICNGGEVCAKGDKKVGDNPKLCLCYR